MKQSSNLNKNIKLILKTFLFSILLLFCFSFLSCGMRAEQKSLTYQFEAVDALIAQSQYKEAIKELKSIQKSIYDSWSYLGIYRRYKKIGENDLAEKLLKKALKKNGANQELLAVYSNMLLQENRLEEAIKISEKLKGGKYGSLYSEAILKDASQKYKQNEKNNEIGIYSYFCEEKFYDIYFDAYQGSGNPIWLRNCAVFNLTQGMFGVASRLLPESFADADDAYFWSLVLYDAGKFYDSIEVLEQSKIFLRDYENKNLFKVSLVKQIALESDCYMAVSQMEKAEEARQEVIVNIDNLKIANSEKDLIPIIFTNSAIWSRNQGFDDNCANLLFYVVNSYPTYVPALIQYADFAYESNLEREEDDELKALRKAGISTIEMEKYDNRRKIPLSDAMYRIDEALKITKNPYLEIKKIDLTYKTDKRFTEKEKNRNLWNLLENNLSDYEATSEFKTLLVQYAVNYLLSTKQVDDAWNLYSTYLYDVLKFNPDSKSKEKENFWDVFIKEMKNLDLPMVEIAAWFAVNQNLNEVATRIYEYCVYESNGILEDNVIAQYVSTGACMNLADIYYSNNKKEKAIDLYGRAVGRESKNPLRSDIYLRIANIYYSMGDYKSALRSVEYSKDLFPDNVKAGLLKDKILSKIN